MADRSDPAPFAWRQLDVARPGDWRAPPGSVIFSLLPLWLLPPLLPALSGAQHIVALSTSSVVAKAASADPSERELVRRIAAAERQTAVACQAAGIAWTVLRPTLIYEPGKDRNITAIARFIRTLGFFPVAPPANGLRQPVHADDVAWAALAAAGNPQAAGAVLHVPGGETLSYKEMVRRVFRGLRRRSVIVPLPASLLRTGLRAGAIAGFSSYSPAMFDHMNRDLAFDGAPARGALGYNPRPFHPEFRTLRHSEGRNEPG